jgi:hypothetical protein
MSQTSASEDGNKVSDSENSGLELLAERLCAAYISAQMGFASVDYVIKRYVRSIGKPPSDVWFQIAEFVSDVMVQAKPLPEEPLAETPAEGSAAPASAPVPITRRSKRSRSKKSTGAEK